MLMSKTLLLADTHLKPFNENNPQLSNWEKESQRYALDRILSIIKENEITKIIHLGDMLEEYFPKDFELELLDYFFGNISKGIEIIFTDGNHELNRDSIKRTYYWEFMKEYYKEKYNIKVYDYVEVGKDLYCSHKHISKLETLNKKYRYVFSHIRSSDSTNKFITDEINMVALKQNAQKVFLGDIHQNLEYDNIVYTGQSTWTNFINIKYEEGDFERFVPSVILLDEENGKYERVALFERNSPYRKLLKNIEFEDFDSLKEIADEIEKDFAENKTFYKVRIMAKKFTIDKVREAFKHLKHCVILDITNLTLRDTEFQTMQVGAITKDNLDKGSVSANCLEYCKRALSEPRLEDLLCSTYATLEGALDKDNLKEED